MEELIKWAISGLVAVIFVVIIYVLRMVVFSGGDDTFGTALLQSWQGMAALWGFLTVLVRISRNDQFK